MAEWRRKSGMVLRRSGGSGFTTTKNSTNEASMLLKTQGGKNELLERS
jgi:hypothetical protein